MMQIIESSEILILRHTQKDDIDFILKSEREPENKQYVGQWTEEQHLNSLSQADILHLTIEEATTHKCVGYAIMAGLDNPNHSIELKRIVITTKGKGLGREALKLIKKTAFKQLKAHRLWLDVRYKNQRAQNLYRTEGFIEEGILRECIFYNGEYESLIVMSVLEPEHNSQENNQADF